MSTTTPEGERNATFFTAVLFAREDGKSDSWIQDNLIPCAARDGLSEEEISTTLQSAMERDVVANPPWEKRSPKSRADTSKSRDSAQLTHPAAMGGEATDGDVFHHPFEADPDFYMGDTKEWLEALFEKDEIFSWNANYSERDGKCIPRGRGTSANVGEWIADQQAGSVYDYNALGAAYESPAGVWARINPMDGKGIKDSNVTDYRHALVEMDNLSITDQWDIVNQLRVPCSTVVHSGRRSLHFTVKVDAGTDRKLYDARVKELYELLDSYGRSTPSGMLLDKDIPLLDKQNKNPSRLSRIPGCYRDRRPQFLIARHVGCASWYEWIDHLSDVKDGLPPFQKFSDWEVHPPELAPEVIEGILRQGHKMLLSGPSKASKSFALIELAHAISIGGDWLGNVCKKGRVLYINLEIDPPSFFWRVKEVEKHVGLNPKSLDVWNLRGFPLSMGDLTLELTKRIAGGRYSVVIVDPAYKAHQGDENSAQDMSEFCACIDRIARSSGASIVFCGHFAKGHQGGRASIDRTSGSGVFGRDPDAIGTLTEVQDEKDMFFLEWTLREFSRAEKSIIRWEYPIHTVSYDLEGYEEDGGSGSSSMGRPKKADGDKLFGAWWAIGKGAPVHVDGIADKLDVTNKTVRRMLKEAKGLGVDDGMVFQKGTAHDMPDEKDNEKNPLFDDKEEW